MREHAGSILNEKHKILKSQSVKHVKITFLLFPRCIAIKYEQKIEPENPSYPVVWGQAKK